ncbi:undecaprenyl-phosphate glucose phosphotransferase [Mesonia ostreae]|uniref:Undecaprenyl-phosphate glucose phosphotransferase n=1 Tax=Mesonia ostreae TaxID=861110 RepID=A0ABU2KIW0_9FLAO|nr:undecaprenyl-phosphate glucose phosphotransferase [Mesonia ostreae]MDT0294647.1 undecaprenyl-phosphate glucose phosphotransferase [Mesonia ostreae]
MQIKQGRYSAYLRPLVYLIDIAVILLFALQFKLELLDYFNFTMFVTIGWLIMSIKTDFYEVYRFTKVTKIISLNFLQAAIFTLFIFSFFGFFEELSRSRENIFWYVGKVFSSILVIKLIIFYLLKSYRKDLGGNYRTTIILGDNQRTRALKNFFNSKTEYGYQYKRLVDFSSEDFDLKEVFNWILENKINEIYCSVAELNNEQLNQVIEFADNNLKPLKFLPDNKDIYTRQLKMEYYGYLPILSLRNIPIDDPLNKLIKRAFDIVMSILVIVCVLSWLTPLLAILIRMESKGPIFFRQKRNGLDYKEFYCYKFRSMRENPQADLHQVKRGDKRITNVGKFIRKTSIDEMPQFYNVLLGDMSVVGPRPHMVSHTHMYAERIDKFMVRHFIKPGITGLAQTSGFRGEVETENDIINRVRYDIFYLENWSLLLDLKIVFQTIYNAVKGDDKAY